MPPFVSGPPAAPPAATSPALVQTVVALLLIVLTLLTLAVLVPRIRRARQRRALVRRAAVRNVVKEKSNAPAAVPAPADAHGLMAAFCERGTGARKASPTGASFSSEKGGLVADEDEDMDFWCQGSALTRRSTRATIMGPVRPDRPPSAAARAHAVLHSMVMVAGSPSMPALGPSRAAPFPAIPASTTAPTVLCSNADAGVQVWTVVDLDSTRGLAATAACESTTPSKPIPKKSKASRGPARSRARARTVLGDITSITANANATATANSTSNPGKFTSTAAPPKAPPPPPAPALYAPLLASSTWASSLDTDTDSSGGATEGETPPYAYDSAGAYAYVSASTSTSRSGTKTSMPLPRIVVSGSPVLGGWS